MLKWLRRLFEGEGNEPKPPTVALPPPPLPDSPRLDRLRVLLSTDCEAALAQLRQIAGTADERAGLELVVAQASRGELDEVVRIEAARLYLQRGAPAEALTLLGPAQSLAALALRAEAYEQRGALAEASASLEKILACDIDAPGVRERLARLRERLGVAAPVVTSAGGDQTLFTAEPPRSPFRILAEAGRGGAAVVYRAEDEVLGRLVALKVYHQPAASRGQIEREAQLAASAAGAGVVRLFDLDLDAGWLALEWAEGGSLRDAIVAGDLGRLAPVSMWLGPLIEGLARLHAKGWAHGDLKPGNVLFSASGAALLGDFGQAKHVGERWSGGTVGYLSPARVAQEPVTLKDDVYALGRLVEEVLSVTHEQGAVQAFAALCLGEERPDSALALRAHPVVSAQSSSSD